MFWTVPEFYMINLLSFSVPLYLKKGMRLACIFFLFRLVLSITSSPGRVLCWGWRKIWLLLQLFCRVKKDLCHPIGVYDIISRGISMFWFLSSFSIHCDTKSFNSNIELENQEPSETLFTTKKNDEISLKQNRPALVVSSTSWWGHITILWSLSLLWHHHSVIVSTRTWTFSGPLMRILVSY